MKSISKMFFTGEILVTKLNSKNISIGTSIFVNKCGRAIYKFIDFRPDIDLESVKFNFMSTVP